MTVKTELKMYILVRDSIPLGLAVNSVGHATLACYRKFPYNSDMKAWVNSHHFKKVTCVVNDGQFESAKKVKDHIVMTERALGGEETCIAFCPRTEWPKYFQFYQLFGRNIEKQIEELEEQIEDLRSELIFSSDPDTI